MDPILKLLQVNVESSEHYLHMVSAIHNSDVIFCGNDADPVHIVSMQYFSQKYEYSCQTKSIKLWKHNSFRLQCFLRGSLFCLKGHFLMF